MSICHFAYDELCQRKCDLEKDYSALIEECRQMLIDHEQKNAPVDQDKVRRLTEIASIYMGMPMEFIGISKEGDV